MLFFRPPWKIKIQPAGLQEYLVWFVGTGLVLAWAFDRLLRCTWHVAMLTGYFFPVIYNAEDIFPDHDT